MSFQQDYSDSDCMLMTPLHLFVNNSCVKYLKAPIKCSKEIEQLASTPEAQKYLNQFGQSRNPMKISKILSKPQDFPKITSWIAPSNLEFPISQDIEQKIDPTPQYDKIRQKFLNSIYTSRWRAPQWNQFQAAAIGAYQMFFLFFFFFKKN